LIPWQICTSCGKQITELQVPLIIAGKIGGILLFGGYLILVFAKQTPFERIGKMLVPALLIGSLITFLAILHLNLVSRGSIAFCDLCKLYWCCFAVALLDYCIRFKSRIVLTATAILPLGILFLYQPVYLGFWSNTSDTLLESFRKPGIQAGRVVQNLPGLPATGTVVLLSNCPPCREQSRKQLQRFLRETISANQSLTFVFVRGGSDRSEILPWISTSKTLELTAEEAEQYFSEFNISLKTFPYVAFLENYKVSTKSRFFGD
jgi:hypothetical protein